nr:hypothetical protein [Candidatus Babeliales bacterium]
MLKQRVGTSQSESEQINLVDRIATLPHKILKHHHLGALSQMILHELGHNNCFGLKKAIYLVDNPDFDHLVGAAGFCEKECPLHQPDLWMKPDTFPGDMKDAHFHNDIRKFLRQSLKRQDINLNDARDVDELGKSMGLNDPQFFSWNM